MTKLEAKLEEHNDNIKEILSLRNDFRLGYLNLLSLIHMSLLVAIDQAIFENNALSKSCIFFYPRPPCILIKLM